MRSNFYSKIFSVGWLAIFLFSCAPTTQKTDDENVIGQELQAVTPLRSTDGAKKEKVSLFDPIIKKIHQFNLSQMSVIRTLSVLNPDEKHFVLDSGAGQYIVDLSFKHITIFDQYSNAYHNPIQFQGSPRSAAFRPDLGWLVIYDDLQSVGVLKLTDKGQIQNSYIFGSVVDGDRSIVSGDLQDNGELILALSDNSLAVVDLEASLAGQPRKWISSIFPTALSKINWIAPVPKRSGRLLMKTSDQVLLFDVPSKSVIESLSVLSSDVIKLSKSFNPHVVVASGSTSMKLIYTDGDSLVTRSFELKDQVSPILNSDLDLQNDQWTYVYLKNAQGYSWYNDVNQKTEQRQIVRFRVSDKLALQNKAVVDGAQIKLSSEFIFALYPSVLGYAKKISIMDSTESEITRFNLKKY